MSFLVVALGGGSAIAGIGPLAGIAESGTGTIAPISAQQLAESVLQDNGPATITCAPSGTCEPLTSAEFRAAVSSGRPVFGRAVYGDLTQAMLDAGTVFSMTDLICGTGVPMTCHPASDYKITLRSGQSAVAVYQRTHAVVDESRVIFTDPYGR